MSSIKNIIKSNKESIIGTWQLNFIPLNQKGVRLLGKLFATDKNLYFDVKFDSSLTGLFKNLAVSAAGAAGFSLLVSQQILNQWKDNGYITIPKSEIINVTEHKSFIKKTVTIKLSDNSEYIFDYGLLSVSKIAEAIKK
jgi:hypothetical protein